LGQSHDPALKMEFLDENCHLVRLVVTPEPLDVGQILSGIGTVLGQIGISMVDVLN